MASRKAQNVPFLWTSSELFSASAKTGITLIRYIFNTSTTFRDDFAEFFFIGQVGPTSVQVLSTGHCSIVLKH